MTARVLVKEDQDELLHYRLSLRLGPVHARQRIGIEQENEARVFGRDKRSFHLENLASAPGLIRFCLQAVGLFRRAQSNTLKLNTEHNTFLLPGLPSAFEGFRILHLTDLHVDMDEENLEAVIRHIAPLDYDLCVLTGDYRQRTWGLSMTHWTEWPDCVKSSAVKPMPFWVTTTASGCSPPLKTWAIGY